MSYKNTVKCGPNVTDNFNDWTRLSNYNDYRYHTIIGSGVITSCEAMDSYPSYDDRYNSIDIEITEFADSCFNKASVSVISLPSQLKKIGNHCFEKSNITTLKLPDTLEEIGHNNFPATLNSITIPPLIEHFPVDNLLLCNRITEIGLHKDNKSYRVIDGILYNYDVTEILYCPNAKKGKIIIPDSVKKIGDYCFYNNKQLTSVNIPTSVESIGKYAFCGAVIDNLVIPNSVVSIGLGCFQSSKIHKNFKFSHNVSIIPDKCFCQATIPTIIDLARVQKIGSNAFDARTVKEPLPEVVSLQYTEYIGKKAFYQEKKTNFFELFSCIKTVDESAFIETADNLIVKFFSYVPVKVNINAFKGMGNNTTLMIPKGTKQIFENTIPWSVFDNIVEMELGYNIVGENVELISNDEHIYRLQSILDSIKKVNRESLRDIILNLSYNYENITTDEEYDQALALIAYNNRFIPAIIPNLEVSMCKAWNTKYKLKILNKAILEYANVPALENFMNTNTVRQVEKTNFPLLSNEVISNKLLSLSNPITVESYFDDILTILQNELCQARSNIKIAVSWFTNYALFKTVNQLAENGVEVQIIINNDSINNGGYCLDFNDFISKNNVKFSLVEYPHLLHHKFCIIDDKTIINGSYNWTRFSGSNYENIMIIRNDKSVVDSFNKEFERIIRMAEHQNIDRMPNFVRVRPEYDRNAFKQYITEELDSQARETSDERDKITLLHKASCLNPEYFEKINPSAKKDFADAFRVLEEQTTTTKDVIEMIDSSAAVSVNEGQNKIDETKDGESENLEVNNKKSGNTDIIQGTNYPSDIITVNCQLKEKLESIKASSLFLVLDVSGSMDDLYKAGHVHNIAEKVLSVSLTISESKEISLWKFGDRADFVENIGLENVKSVKNVHCEGTGTELNAFVDAASSSINDGSLVIIFTDDDLGSIQKAASNIKNRSKVFWQIIVYGEHKNISSEISDCSNASLICMDDYASKSNSEINQILLKDYISWKNK